MAAVLTLLASSCSSSTTPSSRAGIAEFSYSLTRKYIGTTTNALNLNVEGGSNERYEFTIESTNATSIFGEGEWQKLQSQSVDLTYFSEGVYNADFKVRDINGIPYIFEVLTWEYSTERPDPPVVSFAQPATKHLSNALYISDSRAENSTDLWVGGDVDPTGRLIEEAGYWIELESSTSTVPITLTAGDGLKSVQARIRNVFGNESDAAVPAEIILKQTPPTNCSAAPLNTTIANNKLSVLLNATDPYQMYYSVTGSLGASVAQRRFSDGEVVFIYVEPTPGTKTVNVYLEDIAGNRCLEKTMTIILDPGYESEGIWVQGATYWTESENIVVDAFFDHFPSQEPLQLRFTGDVFGPNVNSWVPYVQGLSMTLTPNTSGSRRFFVQYKDIDLNESYLMAKNIFLKPGVVLNDLGGGLKGVVASNILGANTLSIAGCVETYSGALWAASYNCTPAAASIDVTWTFPSGPTLTKSAIP